MTNNANNDNNNFRHTTSNNSNGLVHSGYHILGKVGEGAHGVVLKAKLITSGKIVALKKVPLNLTSQRNLYSAAQDTRMFGGGGGFEAGCPTNVLREVKALQILDHPNVRSHFPFLGLKNFFSYL